MPAPITRASQLAGAELLELELVVELMEPVALGLLLEPLALELMVELLGAGALGTGGREAGCDLRGWALGLQSQRHRDQLTPRQPGDCWP